MSYSTRICTSSEWAGLTTGGRVDFLVTSMGWAIECIREGDRLEEHIASFQEGGRYYQWIQSKKIQDYIMLDFRKSRGMMVLPLLSS